jgi:hypothetical protein
MATRVAANQANDSSRIAKLAGYRALGYIVASNNGLMASEGRSALAKRLSPILGQASDTLEQKSKTIIQRAFRARGYRVVRTSSQIGEFVTAVNEFVTSAKSLELRRNEQDFELVEHLRVKHSKPAFGHVPMWDLLMMLGRCIDPMDRVLGCVSQLVHALQVAASLQATGVTDPDLIVAALIHDVGKLLILTGEDPAYICGVSVPMGRYSDGCGLDNCVLSWGADEIAYMRLKDQLPDHIAWLVRYHSIDLRQCARLMDERDIAFTARYLNTFAAHDLGSKSTHRLPTLPLDSYRELVESYFPSPILF